MRNDNSKTLFSFAEIHKSVRKAQKNFSQAGLCKGDRVAIIAPHSPYAILAGLSLAYSNITSVLIDVSLPTEEINRLLDFSDVRAVFTVPTVYEKINKSLIDNIPVFDLSKAGEEYSVFENSTEKVIKTATTVPHLDVITILYSSGTTATVKGVMTTYKTVVTASELYLINTGLTADMTYLLVLPFNHVAGYANSLQYFLTGCQIGMIEDVDPSKLSKGLLKFNPVFFAMVPRVYEVMESKIRQEIRSKGERTEKKVDKLLSLSAFMRKKFGINIGKKLFRSIRIKVFGLNIYGLGTGGALCNKETSEFYLNLGFEWANFYALTETYVPCVGTGIHDRYPAGTVGNVKRHDGIEIKIHNPDKSGIGEIRIKTVLIMKGYFRDPESTATAFDEDGYFKTGDLGYIDKKDYLYVTGRMKESILLHTGKKVAPSDVDTLYNAICPEIAVGSCGVPTKNGNFDEIHLFIESNTLSEDEQQGLRKRIIEFSAETSTLYQISKIHFIDKLPTTAIGKIKRFKLKEIALDKY